MGSGLEGEDSTELRINGHAYLIERLARLGQSHGHSAFALTDGTDLRHGVGFFVAGEQGVVPVVLRTSTMTTNAIDDVRNLTHAIEQ